MENLPGAYELYSHYTGKLYQIIAVAENIGSREQLVVYQAMSDDFKIYAQPLSDFNSKVDKDKYPAARQTYCFERWEGNKASEQVREKSRISETADIEAADYKETAVFEETAGLEDLELSHEFRLDPMVLKFLDADSYEERLNILTGIRHRVTDEMITTMSVACDLEVGEGSTQERFEALKNCLVTLEKYECNRIR